MASAAFGVVLCAAATGSTSRIRKFDGGELDIAVRDATYPRLFVMLDARRTMPGVAMDLDEFDSALEQFELVSEKWRNITFALVPIDDSPLIKGLIASAPSGDTPLPPMWGLCFSMDRGNQVQQQEQQEQQRRRQERVLPMVPFIGQGKTAAALLRWLSIQDSIHFRHSLDRSRIRFTADAAAHYVWARGRTMVFALFDEKDPVQAEEGIAEFALAARSVPVRLPIRLGNSTVARTMGVPSVPCVVVVHSSNGYLTQFPGMPSDVRWPMWSPTQVLREDPPPGRAPSFGPKYGLSWAGLREFLSERAHPPLIPHSDDSEALYASQLRRSRHECTVFLFHNAQGKWAAHALDNDQRVDVRERSASAIAVVGHAATKLAGVAAFVSIDFFANSPELASRFKVSEDDLPIAVVAHDRLFPRPNDDDHDADRRGATRLPPARLGWQHGLLQHDEVLRFLHTAIVERGATAPMADTRLGTFWVPQSTREADTEGGDPLPRSGEGGDSSDPALDAEADATNGLADDVPEDEREFPFHIVDPDAPEAKQEL